MKKFTIKTIIFGVILGLGIFSFHANAQSALIGDLNGDGKVDIADYSMFIQDFGKTGASLPADLNKNGQVEIGDYSIFIANFGKVAPAESVALWDTYEITLTASGSYANPYRDGPSLSAVFTGPNSVQKTVKGFWDGGKIFKVRFTPTVVGNWSYSITPSATDAGLTKKGTFSATEKRVSNHGFVRRDPAYPNSFKFDDGQRYFMMGNTYYSIVDNALAGANWKAAIDGSAAHGINKIRMLVYPWPLSATYQYPDSQPFNGDKLAPDHDSLKLSHWQKLDEIVKYLETKNMLADIIMFSDTARSYGTWTQDARYTRYILARFGSYHNVIWCLTNEWNYSDRDYGKNMEYWNNIGNIVKNEDPWLIQGNAYRALSIHQQTRYDFQFFGVAWPVHAIVQVGVRNSNPRYQYGDQWGNYSIKYNLGKNMPVVNDEYGYLNEPSRTIGEITANAYQADLRQAIWGITVAGGYGSAGDGTVVSNCQIWNCADWTDQAMYDDIKRLVDFWTTKGIDYWTMVSRNDLATSGNRVYVLASPGNKYVVYAAAGGTFQVSLAAGTYKVTRFNPRTGAETALADVTGGATRSFTMPDANDWVLYIRK